MITVTISINGIPIYVRSARNISLGTQDSCKYCVDNGDVLSHKRSHGAIKLAIKMLETLYDIDKTMNGET